MTLPTTFIEHLREEGYHPRSNKHSNALAAAIVDDLCATCPLLATRAAAGEVVYDLNFDLIYATATWNVDLVLGAPPPGTEPPPSGLAIRRSPASTVQIAIEIKGIMAEHHKAAKNRKRDLEAHHTHVHNYSEAAIAGGVFVINAAPKFRSPLRKGEITLHAHPVALVRHCLDELRAVAVRSGPGGTGIDAKAALVVSCDNIDLVGTSYVTTQPAPQVGDPLHYDAFIQRVCTDYSARFG